MVRSKITLKPINNEKARQTSMMQRSKGLMKKISEISRLCEVEACLIVYDKNNDAPPMTWPKDHKVVHSLLQKYETQKDVKGVNIYNLEDYFDNKKGLIEAEISKVKKEIQKINYPTWHPCFNGMGEEQLRGFIAMLNDKIGACNNRINMLKNKQQCEANFSFTQNMAQEIATTSTHPIPNQLNFIQNIPQSQIIPAHMNSHSGSNEMVDSTNQVDVDLDISLLANVDYWANFLDDDDFVCWANQSFKYSLQGAVLPPPIGGF